MYVQLTKEQKAVLQKNLAFTSRQKSGERSVESLLNEIVQRLFELMFKDYNRATDCKRVAFGLIQTQKVYKVHLSDAAWTYLRENKFTVAKAYIKWHQKTHRYEK